MFFRAQRQTSNLVFVEADVDLCKVLVELGIEWGYKLRMILTTLAALQSFSNLEQENYVRCFLV